MKILDFILSLLPSFDRQRMLNDIASQQAELSGTALKSYNDASEVFSKKKFKARVNIDFDADFHNRLRDDRGANFISAIAAILVGLPAKLSLLESMITADPAADVTRDAITYKKASIVKYLEVVEFTVSYAIRLLLNTMAAETYQNIDQTDLIGTNQPPALAKWMEQHKLDFFNALAVLSLPLDKTREKLESIPNVTAVPSNADNARETIGPTKLDPLNLGFIVTTWRNPIYHARMAVAEWQVERYKAKKEEKNALEYRLLALQESYQKKQDPRLHQQILSVEGRLKTMNHSLSLLDSDYAV